MAEDQRRPKRSRFDQTEPEPRKPSRFDRRSRSPVSLHKDSRRSRSPMGKDPRSPSGRESSSSFDPASAAAAAAARINAQIQAKRGIQHVDVPPILSTQSPVERVPTSSSGQSTSNIDGEIYIADGDYIKDIEINDLRNRYMLTKGSTQKMIKEDTGADVTTRGNYYPDKSMATAVNPPLYLHVTSTSKSGLEKAVEKIEELMKQELPNLVDERRYKRREPEFERDEFGRRKWPEEKITIEMESIPGFNLRAQVVGQGGAYVKHIQQETRCRVQIKGRGSGFMEHGTGQESDEPMYLHVAGPDPREVTKAKELCEDLLVNVREQYERFKANPPPQHHATYLDGYGANASSGNNSYGGRSYHNQQRNHNNNNNNNNHNSNESSSIQGGVMPAGTKTGHSLTDYGDALADYYAQYYGANGPTAPGSQGGSGASAGQDPYAAYGGYQNYVAYYQAYYTQMQQQQQQQAAGSSTSPPPPPPSGTTSGNAPPPPPPSDASSLPPPPGGSAPGTSPSLGGYNSVPPPPGM